MHAEWQQLASAASLVVALDLDGTLLPFAPTPHEALIDAATADLLGVIGTVPNVTTGIISGRPRDLMEDVVRRFPHLSFAAEHGAWRFADGAWQSALPPVPELEEIERSLRALAQRHPGAL